MAIVITLANGEIDIHFAIDEFTELNAELSALAVSHLCAQTQTLRICRRGGAGAGAGTGERIAPSELGEYAIEQCLAGEVDGIVARFRADRRAGYVVPTHDFSGVPLDDARLALDDLHIPHRKSFVHGKGRAEARVELAVEPRAIEPGIAHEPELRAAEQIGERTRGAGNADIETGLRAILIDIAHRETGLLDLEVLYRRGLYDAGGNSQGCARALDSEAGRARLERREAFEILETNMLAVEREGQCPLAKCSRIAWTGAIAALVRHAESAAAQAPGDKVACDPFPGLRRKTERPHGLQCLERHRPDAAIKARDALAARGRNRTDHREFGLAGLHVEFGNLDVPRLGERGASHDQRREW